jgi:hypothetical protein
MVVDNDEGIFLFTGDFQIAAVAKIIFPRGFLIRVGHCCSSQNDFPIDFLNT